MVCYRNPDEPSAPWSVRRRAKGPTESGGLLGDKFEVAQDRAMVSRGELNYELYKEAYFNMTDFALACRSQRFDP